MALSYWQKRLDKQMDIIYTKSVTDLEAEELKQYLMTQGKVIDELTKLCNEIKSKGADKVLVSHLYQYDKYYKMLVNVQEECRKLGLKEVELIEPKFENLYSSISTTVGDTFGLTSSVSQKMVKKTVNSVWCADGLNWSDRIWKNKAQLVQELEKGLIDCVARGATNDELTKEIMSRMGVGYTNAKRLVRTEMSHLQNEAAKDRYEEAGVEKIEVYTARDARTCTDCQQYDGKVYAINAKNLPELPRHVNCRCTYLPVVDLEKTKKDIAKMRAH